MRISGLLLLFSFLLINNISRSQSPSLVKINDNFENISLTEFFNRLEKQVPYKFYYNTAAGERSHSYANITGSV
jgi:hypothetical protein